MPETKEPEPAREYQGEQRKQGNSQERRPCQLANQCLGGDGRRDRHRHQEGQGPAQPGWVDAYWPAPRLVEVLEDHQDVLDPHEPEGTGCQHEPEAVDDRASCHQRDEESEHLSRPHRRTKMGQCNAHHDEAKHNIAQLPDLYLANAHEKLRIFRLEQGKVQRSLVDLAHQLLHAGLDDQVDDAADELVDAQ